MCMRVMNSLLFFKLSFNRGHVICLQSLRQEEVELGFKPRQPEHGVCAYCPHSIFQAPQSLIALSSCTCKLTLTLNAP